MNSRHSESTSGPKPARWSSSSGGDRFAEALPAERIEIHFAPPAHRASPVDDDEHHNPQPEGAADEATAAERVLHVHASGGRADAIVSAWRARVEASG